MLIDTLSLLLAYTHYFSGYELFLLAFVVAGLCYLLTPNPALDWSVPIPTSTYYYLQWSWLGYLRLNSAFWPFFGLYNAVLFYSDYQIDQGVYTVASWITLHIIMILPLIYWTVAVWRCSDKCAYRLWAIICRLLTIAAYFDLFLRWVIYQYYPNILFNCLQIIEHWGDC